MDKIEREIGDNGMEPGRKGALAVKRGERIKGAHKRILRHIEGVLRIADDAPRGVVGGGLMPPYQFTIRVAVPLQGERDEACIGLLGKDFHGTVRGAE